MQHVPSKRGPPLLAVSATVERCASAARRPSTELAAGTQPCHGLLRGRFLMLATLTAFVACASAGSARHSRVQGASVSSTLITEAEITRAGAGTAYETMEQLRPWYLSLTRTRGAPCERVVYVDRTRLGGLDALRGIQSASVREIQILDARDATMRFGSGHCAGAIVVVIRVGR